MLMLPIGKLYESSLPQDVGLHILGGNSGSVLKLATVTPKIRILCRILVNERW